MSGKRKTTIDKLIGEQIRSLRKREGFNKLTDFKNEVKDLSYSMLQMIERGDRGCSPENLEKIAEALGVSVAEILEPWEIHRIRGRSEVEDSQRDPKILSGNGLRALAMGDINIDWTSYLSESEANMSSPKKEYRYVYSDAERELGGVGALFALKARSAGFENVSLIGAIGGRSDMPGGYDYLGQYVIRELQNANIDIQHIAVSSAQTGFAILIRIKTDNGSDALWTLIPTPNANQNITDDDIETAKETIENADIVHISGYCLDRRKSATKRLIEMANEFDVPVVFDVVGNVSTLIEEEKLDEKELNSILRHSDIIIGEEPTLLKLFGHDELTVDQSEKKQLLKDLHDFGKILILRHRDNLQRHLYDSQTFSVDCDQEIKSATAPTGYRVTAPEDRRGFGDRLTVNILFQLLAPHALMMTSFPVEDLLMKSDILRRKCQFLQESIEYKTSIQIEPMHLEDARTWLENIVKSQLDKARRIVLSHRKEFGNIEIIFALENTIFLEGDNKDIGTILRPPKNKSEIKNLLNKISGKKHYFINCIGVDNFDNNEVVPLFIEREVEIKKLSQMEIDEYVRESMYKDMPYGYGADLTQGSIDTENIRGFPRSYIIKAFGDQLRISEGLSRRDHVVLAASHLVDKINDMSKKRDWNWLKLEPIPENEEATLGRPKQPIGLAHFLDLRVRAQNPAILGIPM